MKLPSINTQGTESQTEGPAYLYRTVDVPPVVPKAAQDSQMTEVAKQKRSAVEKYNQLKKMIDEVSGPTKARGWQTVSQTNNKNRALSSRAEKPTKQRYDRGSDQWNVQTLDYKGRINKDLYEYYPGLYSKIENINIPYEDKQKVAENVYDVWLS